MKKFQTIVATSVVALSASLSFGADCGDVTIAEMNWASASLFANIDKIILTEGYGCNAELVIGDTMPTSTSMVEKGEPDIAPEMWTSAIAEVLERAVADKKIRYAGRSLSEGGEEGFWVPQYMVDKFPEMATIEGVLKHKELFTNPENPDTFRFMGCPAGWNCQITTANLFKALDLEEAGFELVDPGSGAGLAGSIAKAYEREEAWFGYYWAPTALLGKYVMQKVDFGSGIDAEHFKKCIGNKDCIDPQVTMFPPSDVWTVVGEEFAASAGAPIMEYLNSRSMTNAQTNELLAWIEENQADGEFGAMYFLDNYPTIWKQWVSDDVAKKVMSSL
jgi:glycine betaine/proline transport system substrate-binding protein